MRRAVSYVLWETEWGTRHRLKHPSSTLMKTARRPFLLLSLLAMVVLQLPATLWACSMTGLVGTATEVCHGAMPMKSVALDGAPCSHKGGKCCKRLPVPASSQTDDKQLQHSVTLADVSAFHAPIASAAASSLFIWPQTPQLSVPEQTWIALSFHPPPRFVSLLQPSALAGRAPPSL